MSITGGVAATVAVIAARQREELFESFRRSGAVSAPTALTLEQLKLGRNAMLAMQIRQRVVIETNDGRYYLDRQVLAKQEYRRGLLVTGLIGVLVFLLLLFWLIPRL